MQKYLSQYQHHLEQLSDIRVLGQVVFAVVVLLISWSGVKVIHTNYQLQQQILRVQQENEIQKLKNENLRLKNQYFNSPQYLELAARQNFGLAMPGEKELLVPKAVALAQIPAGVESVASAEATELKDDRPFIQRNLSSWFNFFLHRSTVSPDN